MKSAISELPGYAITEQLYLGARTLVYRGHRHTDQQPIVLKLMRNEHPSFAELVQFRNQYTIAKHIELPGVIKPYGLEAYRNGYALITEDFGGISLAAYIHQWRRQQTTFSETAQVVADFFAIALQLADILNGLYQQRIIHKDIKPSNILINPETKQIKLIDFSIASLLPRETQEIRSSNVLEGTLAYLSPEQTGRMNRSVDYRSDFYSLGVTCFELLTGQPPFQVSDPAELIHCHIAKPAPAVDSLNPAIPSMVAAIVRKLMAKNAEDRYQSALGLKYDLERCWHEWQTTGAIATFELGQRDICDCFTIPEKLYGREAEVQALLSAFERIAGTSAATLSSEASQEASNLPATPKAELMLVTGYSGIGKTSVVNEVHKPIVRQRGYFIKGKFDQFQRNIPLSAFVQALRDLIQQLLSETDTQLAHWKANLLAALGETGQVMVEVIPELERIIGPQPEVPALAGDAAQNRFNLLFQKFIQVFATAEHPLVIFIDDLQWADSTSLKLIQLLMGEADIHHLLLIGAYRDNEVDATHPLMFSLEALRKTGASVNTITLAPLAQTDLNYLIADTLVCSAAVALPLTELVHRKTGGNPFFATQFLKALHAEHLITFDEIAGYWQCDLAQVRASAITNDVVEFMALQLRKLPPETQTVLQLAACIGNEFDLNTLAIVHKASIEETATDLWRALQEGLLIPKNEIYKFFQTNQEAAAIASTKPLVDSYEIPRYRFLHDRVQQAAYSLIPEAEKKATHLQIGQLLLRSLAAESWEEHIFAIANQLNIGCDLLTTPAEITELAHLNLLAGRKAIAATAYEPATRYLNTALQLLDSNCWHTQYDLTLKLHIAAAEAEYLNINFARATDLAATALQHTTNLLERVKVHELQMQIHIAQLQMIQAVEIGLQVLADLDISFVSLTADSSLVVPLPSLAELDQMPVMTDPYKQSAMQILKILCAPVFMAKPEIFPALIITMVNLCLEHGHSALSAFAFGFYGLLLSGTGKLDEGYQAGNIALRLLETYEARDLTAKVYNLFNSNIRSWKEHARNSIQPLQTAVHVGVETGDIEWGGYSAANLCSYFFFAEENLSTALQQQAVYIDLCIKIKQEIPIHFSQIWRQLGLNFAGGAADPLLLSGESFDEAELLPRFIAAKSGTVLFIFYVAKTILLYHFGAYAQALEQVERAQEQAGAAFGFMQVAMLNFYQSLSLLAQYPEVAPELQQTYLEQIQTNQAQMRFWAEHAPMNNQHRYDLVAAETARVLGQRLEAVDLYDRAIAGANQNGYIREAALANELAAHFYLVWGKERFAQNYLIEAYYAYARWGAKAKVEALEQQYPHLLVPILQQTRSPLTLHETIFATDSLITSTGHSTSSSTSASIALDLAAVLKASQSLSSEIQLDKLLATLLQVVMENAGADKCVLMLLRGQNLVVEAIAQLGQPPTLLSGIVAEDSTELPLRLVNRVKRNLQPIVVVDATTHDTLSTDDYVQQQQPKSLLCAPILQQGKLLGMLYLENHLTAGAFTSDRVEILKLLCTQAAISLENARLYQQSQDYAQQLEKSLTDLQQTQLQLVQSEKMSALGNLVAGVAHEINNPVGFIAGNIQPTHDYVGDLLRLIDLYQQTFPEPGTAIEEEIEAIDLEYIREDLPKLINSMKLGVDRIRNISTSLRTFSRADRDYKVPFALHEGIDSTILILKHRLKANETRPAIEILRNYGELAPVDCFPGQLNQVFMNILANAIDALEEGNRGRSLAEIQANPNRIEIQTRMDESGNYAVIDIRDNGVGMTPEVQAQVFDHLFTTKPVGKGTGLGLAIARQIVVEKHGGTLEVRSIPGQGAEFLIRLPSQPR